MSGSSTKSNWSTRSSPIEFPFLGILPMREPADAESRRSRSFATSIPTAPPRRSASSRAIASRSFAGPAIKTLDDLAQKMQVVLPDEKVKLDSDARQRDARARAATGSAGRRVAGRIAAGRTPPSMLKRPPRPTAPKPA